MILNVFALLFVLGITFVHSLFGVYSGLINVFCCITAMSVAFGYAEPLNHLLTAQVSALPPTYTEPLVFVLLFVITLAVLRTLTDTFMRGNVRVPMYIDWIGGGICGFVIAQICVGVMVLGFLMLPWGGRVMMFSRYERSTDNQVDSETGRVEFAHNGLWLSSDAFTVGLFNLLSGGSLKGTTHFAEVYPDYPEWVFWSGNTVQAESFTAPLRDGGDGFKDGLKVEKWWEQTAKLPSEMLRYRPQVPTKDVPKPPYEPREYKLRSGHHLVGVRLALTNASADRDKTTAYHRFRPSMIRLVGDIERPDGSRDPKHYIPQILGGADPSVGNNLRIVDLDTNIGLPAGGDTKIDAYFEVADGFKPRFVEYRRHARAAVLQSSLAKAAPTDRIAAAPVAGGEGADRATGAARFIDTVNREFSGERDLLPFAMKADKLRGTLDVELEGTQLVSGHLTGDRSALAATEAQAENSVKAFKLPEGKRLFQLQTKPRQAASLPGQAMNFAGSIVNQYQAFDSQGNAYFLAGYYAIVEREGQPFVELFYTPDPEGTGFRGQLDFKTSGVRKALQDQDDAVLGLLFLVAPGSEIVAVGSQGGRVEFGDSFVITK